MKKIHNTGLRGFAAAFIIPLQDLEKLLSETKGRPLSTKAEGKS